MFSENEALHGLRDNSKNPRYNTENFLYYIGDLHFKNFQRLIVKNLFLSEEQHISCKPTQ